MKMAFVSIAILMELNGIGGDTTPMKGKH